MKLNRYLIFLVIGLFVLLPLISAEQVVWDNDNNITIYDAWRDTDGNPLTGADCSWVLYNSSMSINQSGVATEFDNGIINFSIIKLEIQDIYPLRINCTKGGFNGTSSKDSIKIIDELPEDYKLRLERIENDTENIVYDFEDMNSTLEDIKFILSVNSPKFFAEAYEVNPDIDAGEVKRIKLIVRGNAIEGDPTVRIGVPIESEEDVNLKKPDDSILPIDFKKGLFNNYVEFGATVDKCVEDDGNYDREFNCHPTTYYLAFYKDVNVSEIEIKEETEFSLGFDDMFRDTDYKTKWIIAGVIFVFLSLSVLTFFIVIFIIEKISKRNKQKESIY